MDRPAASASTRHLADATDLPAASAQNPHCLFCKQPLQPSRRRGTVWLDSLGFWACDQSLTGQHLPAVEQ
jgi:hypothetical protein